MPRKLKELKAALKAAGWILVQGGKGSHSKWMHPRVTRRVILSGHDGDDAKRYQEKDVSRAIREAGEQEQR